MPASASIDAPPPHSAADTAVVLVNLGTPDAPNTSAVRRFLSEFLHDHRVVDMSRWLWCPLLHFAILPLRSSKVAHKYASVWLPEGSPLAVHTRRLAEAVQRELPQHRVLHAMRYGKPSWKQLLQQLRSEGVKRVVALPLYPQYSTSTTASVGDVLEQAHGLRTRMIGDYHLDPKWIAAVADSIHRHRANHGAGEHLLFSFHGLPQRFAAAGDPYPRQCEASARAIAQALDLPDEAWTLSYQSRFGRERWLEPATADTLTALAARGVRKVDVVAPGFAVDCLETLEEVALMLAEDFAARGGQLRYVPCLNDSPAHAAALAGVVLRELADWE
ncbi:MULTISPECIES: ferrochelatase [unclassified Lysobacter]|uniref:ferrochelatase n=1 Tax=unclassified Lysobacter TaxID=2635362 RepID=UPI001BEA0D05|nr:MULTISPECIES: ferrochelatase [unclassified Lysobacter]MBT2748062.1 ferrochelatase [Lysobacter sp. ISL-42]MBT2750403.1 ferrochelatase [Lysobacter sp. ISL-50]MBT2781117.1 ferrochelatase [Lysobacter sp. ISL-52]